MGNKTYVDKINEYQLCMATANKLHQLRIISDKDLEFIEQKMAQKYGIKKHSLYRRFNLI